MFIGHFAVGFASKRLSPGTSLGPLMAAPLLLDLLWPIALLLGVEHVTVDPGNTRVTPLDLHDYPWTHSLLMACIWSLVFAGGYWGVRRNVRGAMVIGAGVFSHWVLDWVTHRPDLPLYPGSTTFLGLGLWNSVPGTLIVESLLFIVGVWLYATSTQARNRTGAVSLWLMVGLLAVLYPTAVFGPPPPSARPIIVSALLVWLFVGWAALIDRNREVVVRSSGTAPR